jgi:hypothetical protein
MRVRHRLSKTGPHRLAHNDNSVRKPPPGRRCRPAS